jgi:hypothetical protein
MKKNFLNTITTIILLSLTTLLIGCKKDKEITNTISADFSVTEIGNGGVKIIVTNFTTSGNYKFDFGDGTSASNLSSLNFNGTYTYYYKTSGTFSITLNCSANDFSSSSNSATISDEKTNSITIGSVPSSVKVKYLKLKDFPSTNNGKPWDEDASGPDIQFFYINVATTFKEVFNQTPYPNATTAILPLSLSIDTTSFNINTLVLTFACIDYDSPSSSDFISSLSLNVKESSRQGTTYQPGNTNVYPPKIENSYIEVGLEWLP